MSTGQDSGDDILVTFTQVCPGCRAVHRFRLNETGEHKTCELCGEQFVAIPFAPPPRDRSGMAVASLVVGVVNLVMCLCPPVGVLAGFAGLILGGIGLASRARAAAVLGMMLSLTGLILSAGVGLLVGVVLAQEDAVRNAPAANRPPFVKG